MVNKTKHKEGSLPARSMVTQILPWYYFAMMLACLIAGIVGGLNG